MLRLLVVIEENGVRLRLNIVDTPGYGDLVNNDRWCVWEQGYSVRSCAYLCEAGTPLSSISRISILRTYEKNLRPSENVIFKTLESIAVSSSSNHLDMRKSDEELRSTSMVVHYAYLYRLKPIDIVVLKKLSDVVNVVPVIAKSDSLTLEERAAFKERVR